MKLKLLIGLSGNEYSLSPGDERDFEDDEAERLIAAGYAVKVDDSGDTLTTTRRRGKANVVSSEGDGTND
ncbi:hypothetical protein [Agrobacterium radiobacter]|uniref:hypothetical protein n=1 Tax=Agrobacterium radiobacter TaxID=362 RepID=UPI00076223A4|nr:MULTISPECIES: hypothetical protein [Agrobacterium tumefaciens complex]KAB0462408.1 hypothetical protein F7R04_02165 [Agrobacterium tumefaciens]KWT80552.1 hypothetical protein ASH09_04700 [Agrobacterium radiobacter]NIB09220.1 hypothetical protein [Agrobacterium radiobacter]OOO38970.1 hypothetical protein BS628_02915 [Agrobacterium radiobacter]